MTPMMIKYNHTKTGAQIRREETKKRIKEINHPTQDCI